jgi:hypothetical protein
MAASAAAAASPAGLSGSADATGVAPGPGEPAAAPIDVNGLQRAALLDALRMHAGLKGMPEAVKERIAAESPFDSVADMQMRVNASSKNIRDRLGKAYLPFLHVSAPACLPRGNIRSSGIILGGVGAPIAPNTSAIEARVARLRLGCVLHHPPQRQRCVQRSPLWPRPHPAPP